MAVLVIFFFFFKKIVVIFVLRLFVVSNSDPDLTFPHHLCRLIIHYKHQLSCIVVFMNQLSLFTNKLFLEIDADREKTKPEAEIRDYQS